MKGCLLYVLFFIFKTSTCELVKVTDQIYFDIESEGQYLGRIVIGLFGEIVPKTAANFKQLATIGVDEKSYENSKIHTVIERALIQGGDVLHNNGTGAISMYGRTFEDENFKIKHNDAGIISMANVGPDTNGCQFFISTMALPALDGHNVAFGKVLTGQNVVHKIEHVKTNTNYQPIADVVITRSGFIPTTPFYHSIEPYQLTLWGWIKAGWFPLSFSIGILLFFHWFLIKL